VLPTGAAASVSSAGRRAGHHADWPTPATRPGTSPGDVEVLARLPAVLQQYLLGAGATRAQPLGPRGAGCFLEEGELSDRVDRPALEVPRVRTATSATVAQRSASTAGESEARVCSQEEQNVGAGVPVEVAEDGEFTTGASADPALGSPPDRRHRSHQPLGGHTRSRDPQGQPLQAAPYGGEPPGHSVPLLRRVTDWGTCVEVVAHATKIIGLDAGHTACHRHRE
jgi:hypothetical protein